MQLSKDEQRRIHNYLKDYANYLWTKQEKEYSAVVQLMIKGAIADINNLVQKLEGAE